MKKLKDFCDGLLRALPTIWGMTWIATITVGSLSLFILSIKWLLSVVGVI